CLLREAQRFAGRVLGVDPAAGIAREATASGVPTEVAFFSAVTALDLRARHGRADVIVGTNVLAHAPDLVDFLRGVAMMLQPHGPFVIEAPYLGAMLDSVSFDAIYHEHVSYFSVAALRSAYARAGFEVVDVSLVDTHGGSLRVVAALAAADAIVQ